MHTQYIYTRMYICTPIHIYILYIYIYMVHLYISTQLDMCGRCRPSVRRCRGRQACWQTVGRWLEGGENLPVDSADLVVVVRICQLTSESLPVANELTSCQEVETS
jgi:hypothetical protein